MMLKKSVLPTFPCCAVAEPNDATVRRADAYGQNGRVERAIQARL
jgi:hypothetical protein